jgi:hypothetical protein
MSLQTDFGCCGVPGLKLRWQIQTKSFSNPLQGYACVSL